ncbi:MAG: DUF2752 domain-containing protein [Actinomycetales bacterium]|nr:DUF2752 domain-containing protein [Actinomycetales bacterium]
MTVTAERRPDTDVGIPARIDERPRARRLVAPLATAAGIGASLAYLAAIDPNEPGHYPLCPTKAFFGVDCPGCGMLRGTHDLVTGDIRGALDHNVLLVALVPFAIVLWIRWLQRAWRGVTPEVTVAQLRRRTRITAIVMIALLVFGVVRNFVPYLGSGIG